VTASLLEIPKI